MQEIHHYTKAYYEAILTEVLVDFFKLTSNYANE